MQPSPRPQPDPMPLSLGDEYPGVELYAQARQSLEAIALIERGARAPLVQQLTGLGRRTVNRLYRELTGRPSPPGQMPFTDAWYLQNEGRLLEAAVVWRLYHELADPLASPARRLIEVYDAYRLLVSRPQLCLTRVHTVPRLVAMGSWEERACTECPARFLAPLTSLDASCPGCRLYFRYRCPRCHAPLGGGRGLCRACRRRPRR